MNFQSYLNGLRTKPEHVRERIAFWSAFCITAVIFIIWLTSFAGWGISTQTQVADFIQRADTPAQSLVASAGSFIEDVRDLVFGPRKINYATVEALPAK